MIDAYEIGIQLALQDDVSAGLQVISQGLAEVDRAIDATSAKLANLTTTAQVASGVAAAGVAMRPTAVAAPGAKDGHVEPEKALDNPAIDEVDPVMSLPSSIAQASRAAYQTSAISATPTAPNALSEKSTSDLIPSAAAVPPPASGGETNGASAPAVVQVRHSMEPVAPSGSAQPEALVGPQSGTVAAKPTSPIGGGALPIGKGMVPTEVDSRGQAQSENVFIASIAQTAAPAKAYRVNESVSTPAVHPSEPSVEPAGRATAPWSGVETRMLAPRPQTASERPVAPPARQQGHSEALTGTVMLDGHLVGQWLAEQMAKEASRPPSGTSFFDPRQTPAWSASGSL